jgi:hypothetical protein
VLIKQLMNYYLCPEYFDIHIDHHKEENSPLETNIVKKCMAGEYAERIKVSEGFGIWYKDW